MQFRSRYFSALEQLMWVVASYKSLIKGLRLLSVIFFLGALIFNLYDFGYFSSSLYSDYNEIGLSHWQDPWLSSEESLSAIMQFGFGQSSSGWVEVPNLQSQLSLVSLDSRPDVKNQNTEDVYLYIQHLKKVIRVLRDKDYGFVIEGSFLKPVPEGTSPDLHIRFLDRDDGIWAKISLLHNDGSLVISPPDRLFFPLSSVRIQDKDIATFDKQYLSSIGFQWAGKDLLSLEENGINRINLSTSRSGAFFVFQVAVGECLFENETTWNVGIPGEKTRDKIIFQLEAVTDQKLTFSAWDLKGRVQRGLILSKIQEQVDISYAREMRLSAVRSSTRAVVQWRQHRVVVGVGDMLVLQNGHSERASLIKKSPSDPLVRGTYIVVKKLHFIDGKWQMDMDVYSDMRSKMMPCILLESGFSYRDTKQNE